jgi:hypothetical protein
MRGSRGQYKQYVTTKRFAKYMDRLVERRFCLDVNYLMGKRFFESGQGTIWLYSCERDGEGARAGGSIHYERSHFKDEVGLIFENENLTPPRQLIRVKHQDNRLVNCRYWLTCQNCQKKVAKLYVTKHKLRLECRKCHNLVYLSQMRGWRRIGVLKYHETKKRYSIRKILEITNRGCFG